MHFLRLFADVRRGEARTAFLLTLNVFLLLTAYYLLKVAREPLILLAGGAEVKSYAAAGQAALLVGVAWAYGKVAKRVGPFRLSAVVFVFAALNLLVFCGLGSLGVPLGVAFYLWVGVFSLTAIAQFWSFAADIYGPDDGKRLFPLIGIGSSVGAVAGAWVAGRLVVLGPFALMALAAGILLACLGITYVVHRNRSAFAARTTKEPALGPESGLRLILHDRYLLAVGALMLVLNWVNTNGEYILDRTLVAEAQHHAAIAGSTVGEFIAEFKARYFGWVNALGVLCQLFLVSRVIKRVGIARALLVAPMLCLGVYVGLTAIPVLSFIFAAKVAENTVDYSLGSTAQQGLWLVTDRAEKFKAKQIIDTFLVRAGDVMSALVVGAGTYAGFRTIHFVAINVLLASIWLFVVMLVIREHRRRSEGEPARAPTNLSTSLIHGETQ